MFRKRSRLVVEAPVNMRAKHYSAEHGIWIYNSMSSSLRNRSLFYWQVMPYTQNQLRHVPESTWTRPWADFSIVSCIFTVVTAVCSNIPVPCSTSMLVITLRSEPSILRKQSAQGHDMCWRTDIAFCPLVICPCVAFDALAEMKGEKKHLGHETNICNSACTWRILRIIAAVYS